MRHLVVSAICCLAPLTVLASSGTMDIPLQQRINAAQATARTAAACEPMQPFYWEIGNADGILAGGSVGQHAPVRDTQMMIASASKWVYSGYVAQQHGGKLTDEDIRFLTFRSGYTRFRMCRPAQTVASCLNSPLNGFGKPDPSTADRFDYSGGHMQKHAELMGLGNLNNESLGLEIRNGLGLGADWTFGYKQPQLAGGGISSAVDYSRFLRAVMSGHLQLGKLLGTHAVCANPQSCPNDAVKTPIPTSETWHYSIGHWVEDDPAAGDGAFSSPGAFGFYPWISKDRLYYGILAREDRKGVFAADSSDKPAVQSVDCGRLIRAAWMDGKARQ